MKNKRLVQIAYSCVGVLTAFAMAVTAAAAQLPAGGDATVSDAGIQEPGGQEQTEPEEGTQQNDGALPDEDALQEDTRRDADEDAEGGLPVGGLMPGEIRDAGIIDDSLIFDEEAFARDVEAKGAFYGLSREETSYGSVVYNSEWDRYSSNFYYNQLDDTRKKFWDSLDASCLSYLTSVSNAEDYTDEWNVTSYMGDFVAYGSLSRDEAMELARIFRLSNPQYYFLKSTIWYATNIFGKGYVAMGFYPAFATGSARAAKTAEVKNVAEAWVALAEDESADGAKLKVLHDLVASKVTYNYDILDGQGNVRDILEDLAYSQSAYSVFCTNKTVCAGYAQALEMVLNGAGVDCIAVTSSDHEWNKVRIDDSWYNVDCTWDDQDREDCKIFYRYYGRSDAVFSESSHKTESFWSKYLPVCTLDAPPSDNGRTPGAFPVITGITAAPAVAISRAGSGYQVSIGNIAAGAKVYYTLDGSEPSCAAGKSSLYRGSFSMTGKNVVKAIAVSSGKRDSEVVSCEWHAIHFDANGASGTMADGGYCDRGSVTLPANTYVKKCYLFDKWNTKADGSGTAYADKAQIDTAAAGFRGDVTLYAQWKQDRTRYNVAYVLNGGQNSAANPESYVVFDGSQELQDATRAGYVFQGWYADAAMKKPVQRIEAGTVGNVTLYAKWQGIPYTVVFDGNGADKGSMPAQNVIYGSGASLKTWTYRKTGFYFDGWNTAADGSGVSYGDGAVCDKLTTVSGEQIILYAIWKEDHTRYTITYVLNGGRNDGTNPGVYQRSTETFSLKPATRTAYTFAGWYLDQALTRRIDAVKIGGTADLKLYAKWTPITYRITFAANGGKGTVPGTMTCAYDTAYTLPGTTLTKKEEVFAGWNTRADGTGTQYAGGASVRNLTTSAGASVTLYAQWRPVQYKISYKLKGGKNNDANPAVYDRTETVRFKKPVRKGYTFKGWYTDSKYKNKITKIKKGSKGAVKVYAKWQANQYTVVFKANGGRGKAEKMKCTYGKKYRLSSNGFTRKGYRFTGWNTKKDGTGISYKNKKAVKNLTEKSKGKVTLYAQWKKK